MIPIKATRPNPTGVLTQFAMEAKISSRIPCTNDLAFSTHTITTSNLLAV